MIFLNVHYELTWKRSPSSQITSTRCSSVWSKVSILDRGRRRNTFSLIRITMNVPASGYKDYVRTREVPKKAIRNSNKSAWHLTSFNKLIFHEIRINEWVQQLREKCWLASSNIYFKVNHISPIVEKITCPLSNYLIICTSPVSPLLGRCGTSSGLPVIAAICRRGNWSGLVSS